MSALPFALRLTCCCYCWLTCIVLLIRPGCLATQGLLGRVNNDELRIKRDAGPENAPRGHETRPVTTLNEDTVYEDGDAYDEDDDLADSNTTEKGKYLGSPCDDTCNPDLLHVFCDTTTGLCQCEKQYPVRLGSTKGCAKPKRLGEQCFYRATCTFADQHATCAQVQHNAVCDCDEGYHRVAISKPNKRVFCAEDLVLISADIPTLLGIASGLAVLTGLICFVLKLFSRARYTRPRHYANANHAPPMLFSSDTGIPLTLSGRPSSRSSQRSEGGTVNGAGFGRRPSSSSGSRGPLVPTSRAGSRRPSLASIHSSASSARSYSARRLERERNEKEQRLALQELRLAKQKEQELQQSNGGPTPSPRTPHSTDELLPSVEEGKEVFYNEIATTSQASELPSTSTFPLRTSSVVALIASTSSSMQTETAFTAPTMCTSAFNNTNTAANCSNVVDIFES